MASVFVSYSHKDKLFVNRLVKALGERGIEALIDSKDLYGSDKWQDKLEQLVAEAENFIFVAGPDSFKSPWCNLEYSWAREYGKRIFIVLRHRIDEREVRLEWSDPNWGRNLKPTNNDWEEVAKANFDNFKEVHWNRFEKKITPDCQCKFIEESGDIDPETTDCESEKCDKHIFTDGIARLVEAILRSPELIAKHIYYLKRARNWENGENRNHYLLNREEIKEAEVWLQKWVDAPNLSPAPLHVKYISASNARVKARQWFFSIVAVVIASMFFILAIVSGYQRTLAEQNYREAQSLILSYQALQALRRDQPDQALEMAMEAIKVFPPPAQAQQVLFEAYFAPGVRSRLSAPENYFEGAIQSTVFRSDSEGGEFALIADTTGALCVWDLKKDEPIYTLPTSRFVGYLQAFAISEDGRFIISGTNAGELVIWTQSGNVIEVFDIESSITSVAISVDNSFIGVGTEDGSIIIWQKEDKDWEQQHSLVGIHSEKITDLAFDMQNTRIASASADNTTAIWDVNLGNLIDRFDDHNDWVTTVRWTDANQLVTGSEDNSLIIRDLDNHSFRRFQGHEDAVVSIQILQQENLVISASRNNQIIVWRIADGQHLAEFDGTSGGHEYPIVSIGITKTGERFYSVSSGDRRVVEWSIRDRNQIAELQQVHSGPIRDIVPVTDSLLLTSAIGEAWLWDLNTQTIVQSFQAPKRDNHRIFRAAISTDGKYVLTGSQSGELRLWDSDVTSQTRGQLLRIMGNEIYAHRDIITYVVFDPEYPRALSASDDSTILIWNIETGEPIAELSGHERSIVGALFVPGKDEVISIDVTGVMIRWDLATRTEINRSIPASDIGQVTSMAMSPSGKFIAIGGSNNSVQLLTIGGEAYGTELLHSSNIWSLTFDNDQRLVSGTADGTVVLWDLQSHEILYQYKVGNEDVTAASIGAWDNSQRVIITGSADRIIAFWSLPDLATVVSALTKNTDE